MNLYHALLELEDGNQVYRDGPDGEGALHMATFGGRIVFGISSAVTGRIRPIPYTITMADLGAGGWKVAEPEAYEWMMSVTNPLCLP